jgi:hypothetical protein
MRIHSIIKWALAVSIAGLSGQAATAQQTSQQPTAPKQQVTVPKDDAKDFQTRIGKYLAIQKKAISSVPPLPKDTKDSGLIVKHEKQVADAIRALRPDALPGEIFTPWLRDVIKKSVKEQVQGTRGQDAKATILGEGNPKSKEEPLAVTIKVNGSYPEKAPLSSVPPSVLLALPTLPKEVEYRFVGHDLILRDTKANIVVDILPKAF